MNLPGLRRLLGNAAGTKHRKVLYAAPDVVEAIGAFVPPVWAPVLAAHGSPAGAISFLTGVEITAADDSPPGWFRLVRHDGCEVKGQTVYHEGCTIVAEGTVILSPPAEPGS